MSIKMQKHCSCSSGRIRPELRESAIETAESEKVLEGDNQAHEDDSRKRHHQP